MKRMTIAIVAFLALSSQVFYWGVWTVQPTKDVDAGEVVTSPKTTYAARSNTPQSAIISSRDECLMAKEALDRSFPKARREGVSLGSSEQEKLINCHWPGAELHVPDHKSTLNDYFMYNVILWVKKPRYASIPIHAVVDVSSGNWAGGDEGSCDFWKFPSGWRLTSCTYKHITY